MLNASARNCRRTRSLIAVFLEIDRSQLASPGPLNLPRPRFPKVPEGGRANAAGLNHAFGLPVTAVSAVKPDTRFGRSGALVSPFPDWFAPMNGVKSNPLGWVTIELTSQPLTSLSDAPSRLTMPCL